MTFTITKNYFNFLHKKSKEKEGNDPNNLESVIIKQILDNCTIINDADESRKIHLGDTVNILYLYTKEKKSYKIVHSDRANPEKNEISNLSPMGSTILNSSVGGNCVVKLPIKKIKIKIISKNNENDHDSSFNKYEEILTICSFFKSFKIDNQELKIEPLLYSVYLYYYHPRRGGFNPKFDDVSNSILRFKENNLEFVKSFFYKLNHIFKDNIILCCVPSHDSKEISGSLYNLIDKLTEKNNRIDASSLHQGVYYLFYRTNTNLFFVILYIPLCSSLPSCRS